MDRKTDSKNYGNTSYKNMMARYASGEKRFIDSVIDQFGFTQKEAEIILVVFKKVKAVKISHHIGQFTLTHGAFWDREVMQRAIDNKDQF